MSTNGDLRLTDFKVLVFDVYGTLADWESGIYTALRPLLNKYPASRGWGRKEALAAYSSVESDLEASYPSLEYTKLLCKIYEVLEERLKALSDDGVHATGDDQNDIATTIDTSDPSTSDQPAVTVNSPSIAFGTSIQHWPVFADSSAALHELAKDFKLVVLSNVDHASFRYTHANLSIGSPASSEEELKIYSNPHTYTGTAAEDSATSKKPVYARYWHPKETPNSRSPFSLVLTAQDVKCYKPALGGFQTVLECCRTDPALLGDLDLSEEEVKARMLIVAQSLEHDHEPASQLGLRSVWIDRPGAVTCKNVPEGTKRWTWRFETLGQMARAVTKDKAEGSA